MRNAQTISVGAEPSRIVLTPADIPIEEDAAPAMMMHRFLHPGSNLHFEYTHEGIFKEDFVAFGSCLHRVEILWKTRLALCRQP